MKRLIHSWVFLLVAAALILTVSPIVSAPAKAIGEGETLTIRGDGVEKEITLSRADLEGMAAEKQCYSTANNFPTSRLEYVSGAPLMDVLKQAGVKDTARMIAFIASDGYRCDFTVSELFAQRYYFPDKGEKVPVPAMICLQSSLNGFDDMEPFEMRLIMGQRAPGEQTAPLFVKYLSEIIVSCDEPEKWPEVTFEKTAGPDGVTLRLMHADNDKVKIYYTTDGSEPTVESAMYNVSASYYQPQLNKPLLIDKTTTIRAIAIGAGKEDSDVSSITVSVDDGTFTDLDGFDWAKTAIEALAEKGIVDGVGNQRFDPAGSLNRAMFVTMLGRALNQNAAAEPGAAFSDVDYGSWYGAHVQWAADGGIVNGYPDGTFKPFRLLSVEEMIAMAVRAGGFDLTGNAAVTVTGVTGWAEPYVMAAASHDMLEHISVKTADGITVDGTGQANRAEAAVIVYWLLQALA